MASATHHYLCIHGHFYQPPREDPFTGSIPREFGAAPYDNFNEKITAECYQPNAELGNFDSISFDVGPTLAAWLQWERPDTYRRIIDADRRAWERYGIGNALAQTYMHAILPLAPARDKRTQIIWGLLDFAARYGHQAEGMWLAETAVDIETLDLLAEHGVRFTVLAPWQAVEPLDPTEPYVVNLPSGRSIAVFFFNGPLSGAVSFDGRTTSNADLFAREVLPRQINAQKAARGEDQLIVVATDGELYGHHQAFRDRFLAHLTRTSAPASGFEIVSLGRYLRAHPPRREIHLVTPSAWSCTHGVNRWSAGCSCTAGETAWKPALRAALSRLAERLHMVFECRTTATLLDPWVTRDTYIALHNGWTTPDAYWVWPHVTPLFLNRAFHTQTLQLLEAEYYGQCMFTSCGWFFEDLDCLETRNNIAFARKAISLIWQAAGIDLQQDFLVDLGAARSWRTALTGADLYRQLPRLSPDQIPPYAESPHVDVDVDVPAPVPAPVPATQPALVPCAAGTG